MCVGGGGGGIHRLTLTAILAADTFMEIEDGLTDGTLNSNALFDLILYVPSTIFQLCRDGSSWVEPVLS